MPSPTCSANASCTPAEPAGPDHGKRARTSFHAPPTLGLEPGPQPDLSIGRLAFYGRCSTEDNQDPETSLGWQVGNARKFVEPLGGQVVAEFFDIGQSRSVTWDRRPEASRLLAELKRPNRGWDAVVVGEGTRCWFGNQFSLTAPRFAGYGVDLWVPEPGGRQSCGLLTGVVRHAEGLRCGAGTVRSLIMKVLTPDLIIRSENRARVCIFPDPCCR